MKYCIPITAPIIKENKLCQKQYPQNDLGKEKMKHIPYASIVGSLTYARV